jgi:hypothetical protein
MNTETNLTKDLPDGYYLCSQPDEPCVSLVRLYKPLDSEVRVIGFGVWDGGIALPVWDLRPTTTLQPVLIRTTYCDATNDLDTHHPNPPEKDAPLLKPNAELTSPQRESKGQTDEHHD